MTFLDAFACMQSRTAQTVLSHPSLKHIWLVAEL